jgi:hypothetical protein
MRVLVGRGGQLVSIVGPIGDCAGFAGLESACLVDSATVADRDDIALEDLETLAAGFLRRTGWTDVDPALCAQLAGDMAADAIVIADHYPVGTRLHARFDHSADAWEFTTV